MSEWGASFQASITHHITSPCIFVLPAQTTSSFSPEFFAGIYTQRRTKLAFSPSAARLCLLLCLYWSHTHTSVKEKRQTDIFACFALLPFCRRRQSCHLGEKREAQDFFAARLNSTKLHFSQEDSPSSSSFFLSFFLSFVSLEPRIASPWVSE